MMGRRKSFVELAGDGPMDVADVPSSSPTQVPVASCARRPDNPRPKQPVVDELASTIQEVGQLQPGTIASRAAYLEHRPEHADAIGDAEWVVLYGNRRHLACEQAGVEQFLVHVADDRVAEVIETGIIENIQREPLLPVREAEELRQLHKRYGTTRSVGKKIGKTHVYVSQRLSLLDLVEQLQNAVDEGKLSITNGRDLAKLPVEQQMQAYEAGPPYKLATPSEHQPSDSAVPASSSAAENDAVQTDVPEETQLDGTGNEVSKKAVTAAPYAAPEAVDTSAAPPHEPNNPATLVSPDNNGNGRVGNDVSKPATRSTLPEPSTLVHQMRREYTEEQLQEIIKLLSE